MTRSQFQRSKRKSRSQRWFERLMAILVLINYILVLFDLSYIPLRDFWLEGKVQLFVKIGGFERTIPRYPLQILPFQVTPWYDWVKGIEPFRVTENYLQKVDALKAAINQRALQPSDRTLQLVQSQDQKIDDLLKELRQSSVSMIDTNPFELANKTGTLERIKNLMRNRVFGTDDAGAKQSFELFWSRSYLEQKGFLQEMNFFDREIRPLFERNFYRPIGENGLPVDNFYVIDSPFVLIFFFEFMARTWYIRRRHKGISWFDAMLWRWYDIFLLIPLFRWLRIIPLVIRLDEAQLIDLKAIKKQASQGFVASIAGDITEIVVLRIVNQTQDSIKEGAIRDLLTKHDVTSYIDLNNTNEISEITRLLADTIINHVLPKVQPDLEILLNYTVETAIAKTPAYQTLKNVPGMQGLQTQLTQTLTRELCQSLLVTLQDLTATDSKFYDLAEVVVDHFRTSLTEELKTYNSMSRLESLVVDLLEEVKINYLKRLSEEDVEEFLEQTRALKENSQISQNSTVTVLDKYRP